MHDHAYGPGPDDYGRKVSMTADADLTEAKAEAERLRGEASEWQEIAAFMAGEWAKELLLDADAVDGIIEFARGEVRHARIALAEKEG